MGCPFNSYFGKEFGARALSLHRNFFLIYWVDKCVKNTDGGIRRRVANQSWQPSR